MGKRESKRLKQAIWIAVTAIAVSRSAFADPIGEPVRLGAVFNVTGAQSELGKPSADGAMLAVRRLNQSGGVLGRPLDVKLADGRSDPRQVASQAAALLSGGAVALLGLSDTDMVVPAATEAARAKRVFLTSGATSPLLTKQVPEFLFLACFTDKAQAAVAAGFARHDLAARTAWIIADDRMSYTRLLSRYFADGFTAAGGKVTGTAGVRGTAQGVERVLETLGAQPADVLFLAAGPEEAPHWISELRKHGVEIPILGGDSFDSGAVRAMQAGAGRVYFTTHAYLEGDQLDERTREFVASYRSAFEREPTAFSALGYDAVGLLAAAVVRAGSDAPEEVRRALAQTRDYAGITGSISYDEGSRAPRKTVYVVAIEGGKRSLAASVPPPSPPASTPQRSP